MTPDEENGDLIAGGLVLTSGGILEFTDTTDLSDFSWSGGNSAAGGYITVSGAIVRGSDLQVSDVLENASGTGLYIEADTLTLGSENYSGSGFLGFKQATVQDNLILAGSGGSFTLMDNVVLSRNDDQSGSISGAELVISSADNKHGYLTIAEGIYTATADITMENDGILYVGGSAAIGDAALIVKSELDATSAGSGAQIRVYGNENGTATLDLTGATLTMSGSGNARLTASGSDANTGTAIITNDQFNQITNQSGKGLKVVIESYGVLQVEGNLDNDGEGYSTGIFSNADQTYPAVGTIALGANSLVDINGSATFVGDLDLQHEDATLRADGLTLNTEDAESEDSSVAIKQGIVETSSDINSNADVIVVDDEDSGTSAELVLNGERGSVNVDLEITSSGTLTVTAGNWSLKEVDAKDSGSEVVFGVSSDDEDQPYASSAVTADSLIVNDLTVNDAATVTTAKLDAEDGTIQVEGYLEVTGVEDTDNNYGINLSGATIIVGNNEDSPVAGNFVIGTTAATGLITQESGAGSLEVDSILTADKVIVDAWATYTVSLTDEYLLNATDIKSLKAGLGIDDDYLYGILSVGDAKLAIEGLDDDDEFIAWSNYVDFASIHSNVTSEDLKTKTLVIDEKK